MWSDRVLGDLCDPDRHPFCAVDSNMMLVQLAASGSAVGNSAEWSPALRREPTGVNLNIGSPLLCKSMSILLMLLQQIPSPLLHRSGLLSTGLSSGLFSQSYLIILLVYSSTLLRLCPSFSFHSLFSSNSGIHFSFFFFFHNKLWNLIKPGIQIISKWTTYSFFFHIVYRWLIFQNVSSENKYLFSLLRQQIQGSKTNYVFVLKFISSHESLKGSHKCKDPFWTPVTEQPPAQRNSTVPKQNIASIQTKLSMSFIESLSKSLKLSRAPVYMQILNLNWSSIYLIK